MPYQLVICILSICLSSAILSIYSHHLSYQERLSTYLLPSYLCIYLLPHQFTYKQKYHKNGNFKDHLTLIYHFFHVLVPVPINISFLGQIVWRQEWLLAHSLSTQASCWMLAFTMPQCYDWMLLVLTSLCLKFQQFQRGMLWCHVLLSWNRMIIDTSVGKERPSCHEMTFRTSLWPCPLTVWVPNFGAVYVMLHT